MDKKLPHLLNNFLLANPYIRGGGLIARVWAFERFEYAFEELLKGSEEWFSEQSIYKPLLIWSVTQEEAVGYIFVLKREMIGLDYEERFFTITNNGEIGEALLIHFPGQPIAWEKRAKLIVKNLTWYKELESKQISIIYLGEIQTYVIRAGMNWITIIKVFLLRHSNNMIFKDKKL